jgi:hypothetical protein
MAVEAANIVSAKTSRAMLLLAAACGLCSCGAETSPNTKPGSTGGTAATDDAGGGQDAGSDGGFDADAMTADSLIPLVAGCSALVDIAPTGAPCTYSTGQPVALDPTTQSIVYRASAGTTYLVVYNDATPCDTGWHVVGNQVEICGATCNIIRNDPGGLVSQGADCR